jgi:hypothetical protein
MKMLTGQQPKYWEIIADNLSKAGWSWGCVATVDARGRTIFVADAHRDDGKRFVVHADEKLTAFLELESANASAFRGYSEKSEAAVRQHPNGNARRHRITNKTVRP